MLAQEINRLQTSTILISHNARNTGTPFPPSCLVLSETCVLERTNKLTLIEYLSFVPTA